MQRWKISVSAIALGVLVACRLGPDYNRPEVFENKALEETLNLKMPAVSHLPFQPQDFEDKVLNDLIKDALEQAPDIRTARAHVEAARSARLAVTAGLFPAFDGSAQYQYEKISHNMQQNSIDNVYQAGLAVSWEVDLFGKKRGEVDIAAAQERKMMAALENVAILLVAEVSSAYIGLRTTQLLLEQTKEDVQIQTDLARLTRDKYKSGLSSVIDVNQAEYQLATTKATIPKLETEIESYQNSLSILLGKPAGSLHQQLKLHNQNLIQQPFQFALNKLSELPIEVLRYRPDVLAAEEMLKAQNAEISVAMANLFPSLSLSALFGVQSIHWDNLLEKNSYTHSYQPSVTVPFFHFGALWQNVKTQEATMQAVTAQYEKTLLQATAEVRNVLVGLKEMEKRHQNLETAWQKMNKAAQLVRQRYKSGLVDYFHVLDAEERRIAAQASLTTSSGLLYQNIVNFYKAVGGQFSFDHLKQKQPAEEQ